MKKPKKPIKRPQWVENLVVSQGACINGIDRASRFKTAKDAWNKTNNPHDLLWALSKYANAHFPSASSFIRGFTLALNRSLTYNEKRRLVRLLRTHFSAPPQFS